MSQAKSDDDFDLIRQRWWNSIFRASIYTILSAIGLLFIMVAFTDDGSDGAAYPIILGIVGSGLIFGLVFILYSVIKSRPHRLWLYIYDDKLVFAYPSKDTKHTLLKSDIKSLQLTHAAGGISFATIASASNAIETIIVNKKAGMFRHFDTFWHNKSADQLESSLKSRGYKYEMTHDNLYTQTTTSSGVDSSKGTVQKYVVKRAPKNPRRYAAIALFCLITLLSITYFTGIFVGIDQTSDSFDMIDSGLRLLSIVLFLFVFYRWIILSLLIKNKTWRVICLLSVIIIPYILINLAHKGYVEHRACAPLETYKSPINSQVYCLDREAKKLIPVQ